MDVITIYIQYGALGLLAYTIYWITRTYNGSLKELTRSIKELTRTINELKEIIVVMRHEIEKQ